MKLEWTNEKRKVADLLPADYNPRVLTDKARGDLEASIVKFDTVEPVVVNIGKRKNIIIGGHQRISIYADLTFKEIDVRVPNRELTIAEETELNIRLNKNVGDWDWKKLNEFDNDLLEDFGFSEEELKTNFGMLEAENAEVDLDRLNVLMVYPPETPKLKERVAINFLDIEDYQKVKKAIQEGAITYLDIMKLL